MELRANQTVDRDSVVWVQHIGYRKPHLAIVVQRQPLSPCTVCGAQMRYTVVAETLRRWGLTYITEDPDFVKTESRTSGRRLCCENLPTYL